MPCKHLLNYCHSSQIWSVASCCAKNTPYVPSLHELEKFCQGGNHTVCPAYLFSVQGNHPAGERNIPAVICSMQINH